MAMRDKNLCDKNLCDKNMNDKIKEIVKTIEDMAAVTDVRILCQPWIYDSMKRLVEKLELDNHVEVCPVRDMLPKNIVAAIIDKNYKWW